jgi:Holliday junction resolvasome RuvABC endonuclease subunit
MNLIAFDLGTKCGYAARINGLITSGTMDLSPARSRKHDGGGVKYMRFRERLGMMLADMNNLAVVVHEEVRRHMGVDAAHVYGGMLATLTSECERRNIPYEGVPVQTIKKATTGKGNASKDEMVAAIESLGFNPVDDNEADAIALLYYKINQMEGR